jgi:hypothetical protein
MKPKDKIIIFLFGLAALIIPILILAIGEYFNGN